MPPLASQLGPTLMKALHTGDWVDLENPGSGGWLRALRALILGFGKD